MLGSDVTKPILLTCAHRPFAARKCAPTCYSCIIVHVTYVSLSSGHAQVCAHMLRVVQLQAAPPPLPPAAATTPAAAAVSAVASPSGELPAAAAARGSRPPSTAALPRSRVASLAHGASPLSNVAGLSPGRSNHTTSHGGSGHRSFREYIHSMAASGTAGTVAAAAAVAAAADDAGDALGGGGDARGSGGAAAAAASRRVAVDAPTPRVPAPRASPFQEAGSGRWAAGGSVPGSQAGTPVGEGPGGGGGGAAAELEGAQAALAAWAAALVRADAFHAKEELQVGTWEGCPHGSRRAGLDGCAMPTQPRTRTDGKAQRSRAAVHLNLHSTACPTLAQLY
jgi:hypothetical protein